MQQTTTSPIGISLRQVLPEGKFLRSEDIRASSCCASARQCRDGDLFVAVTEAEDDGHESVQEAIGRGAAAVLAERYLPVDVPMCVVSDSREAFGRVCQSLAGNPSDTLRVVGVTGTVGKTTVSLLIAAVLEAVGRRVGIMGSLGHCDSAETAPASDNALSSPELASWMARMQANGCTDAVLEISSVSLACRSTAGIQFGAACLTNVRRDHLDFHGSVLNYRNAKGRLFQQLRLDGFAVINADDPTSKYFLDNLENPVLTVGMSESAELVAPVVEQHRSEQTFLLTAGNDTIPVRTHIIGDHHVYNCLTAAAVGLVYGIDLSTIARGLESVTSIPRRMERFECGQPFGVFLDKAATPDALSMVLRTLRQVTEGRIFCVLGAAGDRDLDRRPLMGRVVERRADVGVITSENPGTEPPLSIIHDILDGYNRPSKGHVLPDREKAICWALSQARSGDTVLVVGDVDQVDPLANEISKYSDAAVIRTWLKESARLSGDPLWFRHVACN